MALDALGDPWSLLLVRALLSGPRTRESLSLFLSGLDDAKFSGIVRDLLDAGIIRGNATDPSKTDATFELTERGASLAPVVEELTKWGLTELLLTGPTTAGRHETEAFDQRWTASDILDADHELYVWTIDGKPFALDLTGTTLTRTFDHPSSPAATLETSSRVFDSLVFGEIAVSEALRRGDLKLSGTPAAIRRMFKAVGFPMELLDLPHLTEQAQDDR